MTITQSIRIADEATTATGRPAVESTAPADPESGRTYSVEILLISFAALLLEISYTRIVSYKLFYYYTYLVIGLALLGIGSGGVFVFVTTHQACPLTLEDGSRSPRATGSCPRPPAWPNPRHHGHDDPTSSMGDPACR